jgi:hypothetical protein
MEDPFTGKALFSNSVVKFYYCEWNFVANPSNVQKSLLSGVGYLTHPRGSFKCSYTPCTMMDSMEVSCKSVTNPQQNCSTAI